jgi:hypothetical protein
VLCQVIANHLEIFLAHTPREFCSISSCACAYTSCSMASMGASIPFGAHESVWAA